MLKSNYAAHRTQCRISYINTFKDIFLIIFFFFSDNILRRNLINTLRETWVQHAGSTGMLRPPQTGAPGQPPPDAAPGQEGSLPAGPPGAAEPRQTLGRSEPGPAREEREIP